MKRCQKIPRFFWEVRIVAGVVKLVYVDHKEEFYCHPKKVMKAWKIAKDFPQNDPKIEKVYSRPSQSFNRKKTESVVYWRT